MYANNLKRILDFFCALAAICCLSPLLVALTLVGAVKMHGNPFFTQPRPGKDEKIFRLVKFRTMTNARDASGKLLPDDVRLTAYGKFLRSTSLDELPELFNILKGDMAVIGPRPQLVRDMVFMTPEQRKRHTVRQGLSGLAQINGRNAEGRPIWKPMHMQPLYRGHAFVTAAGLAATAAFAGKEGDSAFAGKEGADTSVGADIFARGLCLPSDNKMTPDQQDAIIAAIRECFE